VLLQFDAASDVLQVLSINYGTFQAIFNYWKEKRKRWQKPILRRLQPPPPVNDTNPYNVFRPREKVHRLHTRRVGCLFYACATFFLLKSNWRKKNSDKALLHLQMQRRENNVQSFEKLRQVSEAPEPLWFFNFLKSEQFTFTVPSFSFSLDNIVFSAC
jgi:enhancer of polycomb-like protein